MPLLLPLSKTGESTNITQSQHKNFGYFHFIMLKEGNIFNIERHTKTKYPSPALLRKTLDFLCLVKQINRTKYVNISSHLYYNLGEYSRDGSVLPFDAGTKLD